MPNSKKEVMVWDCKVHNPSCILTQEGGLGCQNSIRVGSCPRPIPREGTSSLNRIFILRRRTIPANVEPALATGTNS